MYELWQNILSLGSNPHFSKWHFLLKSWEWSSSSLCQPFLCHTYNKIWNTSASLHYLVTFPVQAPQCLGWPTATAYFHSIRFPLAASWRLQPEISVSRLILREILAQEARRHVEIFRTIKLCNSKNLEVRKILHSGKNESTTAVLY